MADYQHGTLSVGTTATLITNSDLENDGLLVSNRGPVSVYLGGATVTADQTSTGGFEIAPGEKITVSTVGNLIADLYGITAAGTAVVSWLVVEH